MGDEKSHADGKDNSRKEVPEEIKEMTVLEKIFEITGRKGGQEMSADSLNQYYYCKSFKSDSTKKSLNVASTERKQAGSEKSSGIPNHLFISNCNMYPSAEELKAIADSDNTNPYVYPKEGEIVNAEGEKYECKRSLGFGSEAIVMALQEPVKGHCIAVKFFRGKESDDLSLDKAQNELKILREIDSKEGHGKQFVSFMLKPVKIDGFDNALFSMKVHGPSVSKMFTDSNLKCLPLHQIRKFTKELLHGLDFLHSKCGVIHADIQPHNILVVFENAKNYQAWINRTGLFDVDFNQKEAGVHMVIVDFSDSSLNNQNPHALNPVSCEFTPPEVFFQKDYGTPSDIFSLGITILYFFRWESVFACQPKLEMETEEDFVINHIADHIKFLNNCYGPCTRSDFIAGSNDLFLEKFCQSESTAFEGRVVRDDGVDYFDHFLAERAQLPREELSGAIDLLRKMCCMNSDTRITATKALESDWFMETARDT